MSISNIDVYYCDHFSSFILYLIFFILVGDQNIHTRKSAVNFGEIQPLTMQLVALERLKNIVSPGFLFLFIQIFLLLADNQNWYNILSI